MLYRSDYSANLLGRVTQLNTTGSLLTTFLVRNSSGPTRQLHMLKQNTSTPSSLDVMIVHFGPIRSQDASMTSPTPMVLSELHVVKDVRYYDESTISVLLHQDTNDAVPIMAQVPLSDFSTWKTVSDVDLIAYLQEYVIF